MNKEIMKEMIVRGYQSLRSEILSLVEQRIEGDPIELYNDYYKNYPKDVKKKCRDLGIDFHSSDTDVNKAKEKVALELIGEDIAIRLKKKGSYDEVIKELNIKLKVEENRITNGIETCEWFVLFGSPLGHNWFSQKANNLLELCDSNDEYYPKLVKMIDNIKANWDDIDPQNATPDITKWKFLASKKVPDGIRALITK